MDTATASPSPIGIALRNTTWAKLAELGVVFAVPIAVILGSASLVGENPVSFQAFVWVAYVLMLLLIWTGLRLRGEGWTISDSRLCGPASVVHCGPWVSPF